MAQARERQAIVPGLQYEDVGTAVAWLSQAFGFREIPSGRLESDGRVWHAEMEVGGMHFMLGTVPGFEDPRRHGRVFGSLFVTVEDVDAHCERARAAGARIVDEPEDRFWGDRTYGAEDPAGHRWYFGQPVREVAPGDFRPSAEDVRRHLG